MRLAGTLLLLLAFIACTAPAHAVGFKLGAQVYGVSNTLTGALPDSGSWQAGSGVGVTLVAELDATPDISVSFQPGYAPRDCQQVFKVNGQIVGEVDYDFSYFSLPLLVRVTGDPIGVRGFVTAGLDVSILLDATYTIGSESTDMKDDLDSTTIGALFGAGVMVPVGRQLLAFELRYVQGLSDIMARDGSDPAPGLAGPSIKYRGLQLMVGFLFGFGGK